MPMKNSRISEVKEGFGSLFWGPSVGWILIFARPGANSSY